MRQPLKPVPAREVRVPAGHRSVSALAISLMIAATSAVPTALSLISVKQEIEIGRQAEREIRQQVPELRDREVAPYVDQLGAQLARRAPGPEYPYRFSVANTRDLNAFSLPGGPVWVNRGVLAASTNEAQVAGVLAHEIAHIALRHAADRMTKALAAQGALGLLGQVLGQGRGADATRVGAVLVANGVFLKFSRDDEHEADRAAVGILRRAGYDPHGLVEFMEILRREQRRDPSAVEVFLSTHPSPESRMDELRREIGGADGRRTSTGFARMKGRLANLPAPSQRARVGE